MLTVVDNSSSAIVPAAPAAAASPSRSLFTRTLYNKRFSPLSSASDTAVVNFSVARNKGRRPHWTGCCLQVSTHGTKTFVLPMVHNTQQRSPLCSKWRPPPGVRKMENADSRSRNPHVAARRWIVADLALLALGNDELQRERGTLWLLSGTKPIFLMIRVYFQRSINAY